MSDAKFTIEAGDEFLSNKEGHCPKIIVHESVYGDNRVVVEFFSPTVDNGIYDRHRQDMRMDEFVLLLSDGEYTTEKKVNKEPIPKFSTKETPKEPFDQTKFDLMIGGMDRLLSVMILFAKGELDEANWQTMKHHAEDMVLAANKVTELYHKEHLVKPKKRPIVLQDPAGKKYQEEDKPSTKVVEGDPNDETAEDLPTPEQFVQAVSDGQDITVQSKGHKFRVIVFSEGEGLRRKRTITPVCTLCKMAYATFLSNPMQCPKLNTP